MANVVGHPRPNLLELRLLKLHPERIDVVKLAVPLSLDRMEPSHAKQIVGCERECHLVLDVIIGTVLDLGAHCWLQILPGRHALDCLHLLGEILECPEAVIIKTRVEKLNRLVFEVPSEHGWLSINVNDSHGIAKILVPDNLQSKRVRLNCSRRR